MSILVAICKASKWIHVEGGVIYIVKLVIYS